jgi:hypothetical protein
MAYDERLAEQIRARLAAEPNVTEQRIFGGIAFMIGGNMAVAASGNGGMIVRVDPAETDELVASTEARPMEMRGRSMKGWLRVDEPKDVDGWIDRGVGYARTLPPK